MIYKNCLRRFTPLAAAAIVLLTANSCRRDLWVFQDNYQQVEVNVDEESIVKATTDGKTVLAVGTVDCGEY